MEPSRNCSSPPPATPRSATHSTHNSLCLPSAVVKALEPADLVEAAAYPSPTSLMTTKSCIVFHLHKTTTLWDTRAELAESPSNSKRRHLPPCSRSRRTSVGDAVGTAVEAEGHSRIGASAVRLLLHFPAPPAAAKGSWARNIRGSNLATVINWSIQ